MSRRIIIDKYQGNTHYNVHVIDSFGQEHHLGYYKLVSPIKVMDEIELKAEEIWENEVELKKDPLGSAIKWCVDNGPHFTDSRGNHRDGLD
jgi:hypothetical protein